MNSQIHDDEERDLILSSDIDLRTTPLFKTSPERIGLAIGDELEDWNYEFTDCGDVTWYSGEPAVQVSIGYVRADLYETEMTAHEVTKALLASATEQLNAMRADRDRYMAQNRKFWWVADTNGDGRLLSADHDVSRFIAVDRVELIVRPQPLKENE